MSADVWQEIETLRMRLRYAREALIATGYFTADQVGDDVAPRIAEMWSALKDTPRFAKEQRHGSYVCRYEAPTLEGLMALLNADSLSTLVASHSPMPVDVYRCQECGRRAPDPHPIIPRVCECGCRVFVQQKAALDDAEPLIAKG